MKLAIVGSRNLTVENLDAYLPEGVTEIVSGGVECLRPHVCAGARHTDNGISAGLSALWARCAVSPQP